MALTINTNIGSLNAQRNLLNSQNNLSKSMTRLASGLRINSAKDDAAGLAISDRMTAQVRGLNQAVRNANDGISLAQTAEGALQESTNILQRMRELAVQAANDTNDSADRASIGAEIGQLQSELDRISSDTAFNGTKLLNGSFSGAKIMVGANSADQNIDISIDVTSSATGLGVSSTDISVSDNAAAKAALGTIDTAISSVASSRGKLGAVQNRLESTISNLSNVSENLSAARSRILDADVAQETSAMTKYSILQQAGVSLLAQANQQPQVALSLLG